MKKNNTTSSRNKETIFDYNVTEDEWKCLLTFPFTEEYKKLYLAYTLNDTRIWHLARLFQYRGDQKNFHKYANMLPKSIQSDFWRTVTHF